MRILIVIMFLFIIKISFAQDSENSVQIINNVIENIASNIDKEIDYTSFYEQLIDVYNNPININTCTKDNLSKLVFLNDMQINNLIEYRKKYGKFLSIYELKLIDGFNYDDVKNMIPFITIETKKQEHVSSFKNTFKYGRHTIFLRYQQILEEQKGYHVPDSEKTESNYYLGSPAKLYARYGFKFSNKVQFGLTAEKDAGEEFFKGTQPKGFDFYSGFVEVNNIGIVKKIIVGDFLAQFGQGLVLYRGLFFNKSTDVLKTMKTPQGIRKYSSSNELEYFRGGAIAIEKSNFIISVFYSNHKIDGTLLKDTVESYQDYLTSIYSAANHAILLGINKKNAVNEQAFGGNVSYSKGKLKLGLTSVYSKFSTSILPDNQLYNLFNFSGDDNINYGLDYQLNFKRFYFFGEFASDKNLNFAMLQGVNIKVIEQVYLSYLYRSYAKDFVNLYATGFAESSKTQNETGLYTGMVYYPYKSLKLSAYFDNYKFNWLKYRISAPSDGYDYFLQLDYSPVRDFQFSSYLRQELKNQDIQSLKIGLKKLTEINKLKYRFQITYKVLDKITLKNRFEQVIYKNNIEKKTKGYLLYQDVIYKPEYLPFNLYFRYAIFDTKDYDTRIYAYENDVLYAFSVPAYYGRGSRFYIMTKIKLAKRTNLWLRFSQTYFVDRQIIGSNLTEIEGNTKSEIKVQIKFKF